MTTEEHIQGLIASDLPKIEDRLRSWIEERLTKPVAVRLAVDSEGQQIEDFWMVSEHKGQPSYRIAYCPDSDKFGIVMTMANNVEWYMGDYGSFKNAVESM